MRIAIISTYYPQECGLATFTKDLSRSLALYSNDIEIIGVSDSFSFTYPDEVAFRVSKNSIDSYHQAAHYINKHYDICLIQHEFGIFGGQDGDYILELIKHLHIPLVSVLHTILQKPSAHQQYVLKTLATYSSNLIVLTPKGSLLLQKVYDIDPKKIQIIPHGVPIFDYNQEKAKNKLGLNGYTVMLTFGLIGRGKGLEDAIKSLHQRDLKNFKYIILGKTHPNVLAHEGESYRYQLKELVAKNDLSDKVVFIDQFASDELLVDYLTACDIYVTPYPNEQQISSGTLSFAVGAGAAVISTPYWHAVDLLSDGKGVLTEFNNPKLLGRHIERLANDPHLLSAYRNKAKIYGKNTVWEKIGGIYHACLNQLVSPVVKLLDFKINSPFQLRQNA